MAAELNDERPQGSRRAVPAPAGQARYKPTPAEQRNARIMGAWFLGTFVFSIPAFFFYDPILNRADYIVGRGADTRIAVGALLEILLAISGIATAVVIFPIVKASASGKTASHGRVHLQPHRNFEPDVGRRAAPGPRRNRKHRRGSY